MKKIITDMKELSRACDDVVDLSEASAITDLLDTEVANAEGIGLAANQIGINKKAFVLRIPVSDTDEFGETHNYYYALHFANAKITKFEEPIIFSGEGCLSFPNEQCETIRYNKIHIEDLFSPKGRILTGLYAIAAYHELDHTMGITSHKRKKNALGANDACPCLSGKKFKKCCAGALKKYAPNLKDESVPVNC